VSFSKTAGVPIEMPFGVIDSGGSRKACIRWSCTLAPPGEHDWTVHMRLRCGLFVKLLWPLVMVALWNRADRGVATFSALGGRAMIWGAYDGK